MRPQDDRGTELTTTTTEEAEAPAAATTRAEERHGIELEALAELSTAAHQTRDAVPQPPAAGIRTARLDSVSGRRCTVRWRGAAQPVAADVAPEVETELLQATLAEGGSVLVELVDGLPPLVVGAVATRMPRALHLKAATVTVEGEREVLIKSGRAALRLREDGDVELVGSRISASSRGLFRLVGRMLRLN